MHSSMLNSPDIKVLVWCSNSFLKVKQPDGFHMMKNLSLLQESLKADTGKVIGSMRLETQI